MKYLSLGLRALLTFVFIGAGGAKLAGIPMMVETFDAVGLGQWLRYLTGVIEVSGAALLWWPNRQVVGASVLGGTMVGAVLTHWFILGPSAVPAIVLGLIAAVVLFIHRDQISEVLGGALKT
ncbi:MULTISPECIES: DoxX family protein [unclassified Cobetia]|uniref:DoxX family protein n=1 Tax=unclassified Cobetia TaxID=2609414 RepID=UPI0020975311|nr:MULTISPECIES: DoxX family protein [unclassified Cobetia]MCO7231554.1 DoxX family protein [Cobetia sp. Dlab-2-AX]MCO7235131.1 DoxX family protein [Cobetia sp. Dlab-2-U]